jgi:hypothetical protein
VSAKPSRAVRASRGNAFASLCLAAHNKRPVKASRQHNDLQGSLFQSGVFLKLLLFKDIPAPSVNKFFKNSKNFHRIPDVKPLGNSPMAPQKHGGV